MDTKPKIFTFVLMPFTSDFDDIYQLGIKATCGELDIYCERVDEQIFQESILDRIYNQIAKADLIIADMSGKNPNVFYEVGYAHALGKNVILLTKEAKDIPFDLEHYPHIIYDNKIVNLKNELKKRLKWFSENPQSVEEYFNTSVELYLNNEQIKNNPCIEITKPENLANVLYLSFSINNSVERMVENTSFQFGLISDDIDIDIVKRIEIKRYKQKDGRFIYIASDYYSIIPGSWEKIELELVKKGNLNQGDIFKFTIRLFFDFGPIDYPFSIKTNFK
jgi:nucleoside 2-deoxyribosyltransferase